MATKTKTQAPLDAVLADLKDAEGELAKAEEEYAAVDAAIANGDPVGIDSYADAAKRRNFYRDRVDGLLKRVHREDVAARITKAEEIKTDHTRKVRAAAADVLSELDSSVESLGKLLDAVVSLNRMNEETRANASDLRVQGGDTPRELDSAIRRVTLGADRIPAFQTVAAAISRAVENLPRVGPQRLTDKDAAALSSLADMPRPTPAVVIKQIRDMAARVQKDEE